MIKIKTDAVATNTPSRPSYEGNSKKIWISKSQMSKIRLRSGIFEVYIFHKIDSFFNSG